VPGFGFSREAFGPIAQRGAWASLWAGALALGWHFDLLPCPWASLLGIPCPGCGLGRAAALLLRGELGSALLLHPLSPVLVPLVLATAARAAFVHVRGASSVAPPVSPALRRWQSTLGCLLAGLVLALWGARFLGAFGGPVRVISAWGH
jgi:hypothetical protein